MHTSTAWHGDMVPYRFLGSLSPHLNSERGVEGGRRKGVRRDVRSNGYETHTHPSLPPPKRRLDKCIIIYRRARVQERMRVMPFPNEDNYFPRSQEVESGQSL